MLVGLWLVSTLSADASYYKDLLCIACWDFMSRHLIKTICIYHMLTPKLLKGMAVLTLIPSLNQCLAQSRCFGDVSAELELGQPVVKWL